MLPLTTTLPATSNNETYIFQVGNDANHNEEAILISEGSNEIMTFQFVYMGYISQVT